MSSTAATHGSGNRSLPLACLLPLPLKWAVLGAVLSGLLYWLAFPGMDVWPLAFIAWVPLIVSMHRQSARVTTLLGMVAGLTMNVAGFWWLQGMLRTFSGFPAPVCFFFVVLVCSYQGGRCGLFGWLYGRGVGRGWPFAFVACAAFVASELVYPVLFPWFFAATTHNAPVLMQVADLGGPILVGLVVLGANLALAELLLARCEKRRWTRSVVMAGLGILAAGAIYGVIRIRVTDARCEVAPEARVGVVQANMGLLEKRSHYDEGLRRHFALSQDLRRIDNADFLVWSETSAMRAVREDNYERDLRAVSRSVGAPVLFGAVIVKPVSDERQYVLFNSAVTGDDDGTIRGRYDKEYLLAFGEYLPFGSTFPVLYKWSPNSGHFSPGTSLDGVTMKVKGVDRLVSVLICYEDVLPGFTNAMVRHANPELLVNITNDAWFGDTAEPWEHLALSQFRAVEHHRYLVRGTNSGVSAIIDPVGRVVAHSGTFHQEGLSSPVRWLRGRTVYEILGDMPWVVVSCLAVVGAFRRRIARTV